MNNKLLFSIVAIVALVLVSGCAQTNNNNQGNTGASTYNVAIQNFAFNPPTITIKKGDTVVWTNQDSVQHTVTSDSGTEMDSQLLQNGQTYSHTFQETGTFDYHCAPHPSMKGKVVVE